MSRLKDKVALITGAGNGIGRATAERFLKEGAKVVALDLEIDETFQDPALAWVKGSAAKEQDLEEAVRHARALGGVDICIANAGIGQIEEFVAGSRESWMRVFDVNLLGVMLTLQLAAREMIAQGRGGRLLATASIAGLRGEAGTPSTAYAASKGAVMALMRAISMEVAEFGITANAVAPGQIDTVLNAGDLELVSARANRQVDEFRSEFLRNSVPLRRMADSSEVAGLYAYLASDEAGFVTGTTYRIDGGELCI
ncbi:glucose 1-dehydrogenase [Paracoccus halophilus]|uniref:Glucose 1-dehydrogenase n=1 Tax=Paracoccus halophilus TaxID=376733 RepID=A0A099EVZ5_9RHOB|nr:SDR family NAD(P)-dependent oxidoreductase [Paracoccus halophilus]KGJ02103.1 N-acylmannosamine 1-dehydrogenase [Paracoccus halophilus]SFA61441.1 glucose 1-dehydrogenase [Paracoccus halophilus]